MFSLENKIKKIKKIKEKKKSVYERIQSNPYATLRSVKHRFPKKNLRIGRLKGVYLKGHCW